MIELMIAVCFVVIVSSVCSLFEAVLYSVPASHIESLVQAGRKAGRVLQSLRKDVDRPIAAILSLNTIANTAGAAVAGAAAAKVFGHEWLAYFSGGLTLTILVFSEVIPKTAGVVYCRPLSRLIARPIQLLVWVLKPMVWLCRQATRMVSRKHKEQVISGDDLIMMVRLGRQAGTVGTDEAESITNILSLGSRSVGDVMTPRTVVFALGRYLTIAELREQPDIWTFSRIPVYDEDIDDVVGIAHRRDLLKAIADGHLKGNLAELVKPVHFVPDSLPLDRLLRMFLERRQHMFVALDPFGGFAGVVTLEDVLEEVLGREIVDEFDLEVDMREFARRRREETVKGLLAP